MQGWQTSKLNLIVDIDNSWHPNQLLIKWADCTNSFRKKKEAQSLKLCTLKVLVAFVWFVSVGYTHQLGTGPMISSSLKQPVCFCQVLSALGTSFCDSHLYLGAGGYRLPLHNSEEPLMRERQMCLYCKQERGDGEWCRAMPTDPLCLPGGAAMKKYGQEQCFAWKHDNTCLCSSLPVFASGTCLLETLKTVANQLYSSLYKACI